jgi:hypothetical protein
MPEFWKITINGCTYRRGFDSKEQAEKKADSIQGYSATIGSHKRGGLLKHRDFGDHVEVKRDTHREKMWDQRYDVMKRGNPQRQEYEYVTQGDHTR